MKKNIKLDIDTTIDYDVWIPEENYKRTFLHENSRTNAYSMNLNDLPD